MKNKIFSIILSIVLSLPISAWAVDNSSETDTLLENPTEEISEVIFDDSVDTEYKKPISKRKIAKKFLLAMGGVAVSSFAIFFLLTIYNNIRKRYTDVKTPEGETPLESPPDIESAVKFFLEKTKW